MTTLRLIAFISLAALVGCEGRISDPTAPGNDDDDTTEPPEPLCEVDGRGYVGFGDTQLHGDRVKEVAGSDRVRVKPFDALAAEYQRVLGIDVDTADFADTFGAPPARWYEEPVASANTLYAAYSMAYSGCLAYTAEAEAYAEAPAPDTADTLCRDFARSFWDREPTDDQASACATFAVNETAGAGGPRKRWAYACAATLSTVDFLAF